MLARKLRRELWWQRGQITAVTIAVAIAVCCFVASRNSYLDLQDSYETIQRDLRLADWTLSVADLDSGYLERVRNVDGVQAAEERIVVSLPLIIPQGRFTSTEKGRVRLEGRLITLHLDHPPELNQLLIERGEYPKNPNEILVEKHLAEYHDLKPSDTVELEIPGAPENVMLNVSGIAVSAEYLRISRNQIDIMPSPASFGVVWIDRDALRRYRRRAVIAQGLRRMLQGSREDQPPPQVKIEDSSEILIEVDPDQDPRTVLDSVRKDLGADAVLTAIASDELPQTEILRTDMQSLRGFAIFFPVLFLVVGGSVIAVSLSRMIDSQRSLIGTMLAFGVPRVRILLHYLSFTLVVGILGTLLGIGTGVAVGTFLTRAYAEVTNIPRLTFELHASVLFGGVLFGLLAAIFAGLLPAFRAARMFPAQAMRPPAPSMSRSVFFLRRLSGRLPLPVRMAVRNLFRRPGRSLASMAGVAAALVLVLAGAGVVDGLNHTLDVLLNGSWQYDVRVDYFTQDQEQELRKTLAQTGRHANVESVLALPARIEARGQQLESVIEGISPNSALLKPMDAGGTIVRPQQGVVLPAALARQLGIGVGDTLQIKPLPDGTVAEFPVDGVIQGFGAEVFMRRQAAQDAFSEPGLVNSLLIQTDEPTWKVRQHLQSSSQVARVQDMDDLRSRIDRIMEFNYLLVSCMLLFSGILGIAILYTTSTLNIWERRRELGTMQALGLPFRQIVSMVTLEHAFLGIAGILAGIPLGIWAMRQALNLYECDFLTLPLVLEPVTFALAIINVFAVLLLAQWPVLRTISRQNLADTVREREQG